MITAELLNISLLSLLQSHVDSKMLLFILSATTWSTLYPLISHACQSGWPSGHGDTAAALAGPFFTVLEKGAR